VLGKLTPWLPVAPVVEGTESALSRDPRIQELFDADPLTYKQKMKAGMGYQLMRAIDAAQASMAQLTLPLLVMQGECDRMVSPNGAKRLYEQARSSDKTLKLYPECRHEIFNELEKDEIIALVAAWLDERLARLVPTAVEIQSV
jgi:alpha-beta hydrolase superfamily lysophospholipase